MRMGKSGTRTVYKNHGEWEKKLSFSIMFMLGNMELRLRTRNSTKYRSPPLQIDCHLGFLNAYVESSTKIEIRVLCTIN